MWNWISLVWILISLVWNWISLVWNWISFVWNWISFVWNWISYVWNWIRPENGIVCSIGFTSILVHSIRISWKVLYQLEDFSMCIMNNRRLTLFIYVCVSVRVHSKVFISTLSPSTQISVYPLAPSNPFITPAHKLQRSVSRCWESFSSPYRGSLQAIAEPLSENRCHLKSRGFLLSLQYKALQGTDSEPRIGCGNYQATLEKINRSFSVWMVTRMCACRYAFVYWCHGAY